MKDKNLFWLPDLRGARAEPAGLGGAIAPVRVQTEARQVLAGLRA